MAMDTYHGHVRTPADAIKLFEACRLGLLPRVQRRLSEKERQSIRSGSVFVWDEREAGMRRWTDGKSWSASRVSGSFLTYREMEGKRGGGNFVPPVRRVVPGKTPDSGRGSDPDDDMDGEGPDGYRYKPDGLMKQSFSITTSTGQHLHLISYFSRPHPNSPELPQPTTDPSLRHIIPQKGMYPESTVHEAQGPAVTRTPMQQSPYMQSPQHMQQNLSRGPPQYPPYQPSPGYAWPPSPMNTPPFQQHQPYPPHMYSSQLPPPPGGPGSSHNSPHQSVQHYSPHQIMIQLPTGAMAHAQGPMSSSFDRPPPPLSDSSLPPPPHPRGMSNATAANLPSYAASPSARVEQARSLAEQQAQMAQRALQSPSIIDPRLTGQNSTTLPPVQITPRTSTPPQNTAGSRATTPRSATPSKPESQTTPKANAATSQAQTIPSISSLVHSTDSVSVQSDNKSNSSRAGSKSPKEGGDNSRPKDIPHEKLNNLGEDQRAIRVLDRKFVF
ncbi:Gti1/Pac2 family protein [Phlyctema vagabunda]|uniref:Gti1/Pac2 family protein n=1 Tax=Phlyctema vagabunda TaxID=108571 RepID=A0ABR4P942_9HELO